MTRKSGIAGKTIPAAARTQHAATRLAAHQKRTPQQQLTLLDARPGEARRERAKLLPLLPSAGPQEVATGSVQGPRRVARRRARRAVRKAGS